MLKMQASKLSKATAPATTSETPHDDLAGPVRDLSISEAKPAPVIQSKNLDVIAEYKKAKRKNTANFVVVGELVTE